MPGWVDLAALKQAVRLEAVLARYRVAGLRRYRDQLIGCCPIHRGRRTDSFRASLSKQLFHCFACRAGGSVLDFVAAMEQCSIHQAALYLQRWLRAGAAAQSMRQSAGNEERVREKLTYNPPLPFALTGVNPAHPYLLQRGVDQATAFEFGVGFYAGPGLLSGRITIPICNACGQIVAYAGRTVDDSLPKYRLPAGFRKALELFNLHRAAATNSQTVIVVEGYFDCLRVRQAGLPWVVALMGASLSPAQQSLLLERFDRVVLMLDGDAAGRAASHRIAAQLSAKCKPAMLLLPDDAQPDQLPLAIIRQLVLSASA